MVPFRLETFEKKLQDLCCLYKNKCLKRCNLELRGNCRDLFFIFIFFFKHTPVSSFPRRLNLK